MSKVTLHVVAFMLGVIIGRIFLRAGTVLPVLPTILITVLVITVVVAISLLKKKNP